MSRAKWKGPYIQKNLLSEILKIKFSSKNELYTNFKFDPIIEQFLDTFKPLSLLFIKPFKVDILPKKLLIFD